MELNKMLRRLIGEDIDRVTLPKARPGRVKADPGQIEQVILNLAVNARDAMPEGGKLTVETSNIIVDEGFTHHRIVGLEPGSYVVLRVEDTGIGIEPEILAHIFEPFFTTKDKQKGTGLGLATVYGIVAQSGGHIEVSSKVGQGTTFKIYLPQVDQAVELRQPEQFIDAPQGNETILLVEDEDAVRALTRTVLLKQGYHVLEAAHGHQALLLSQQYEGMIDLLATDVVMPQMSGRELAERLLLLRPNIKILYMSGYTEDTIVHHGIFTSGVAFLQKPFSPNGLAYKVREVLDA
jgi:CheY-like chemotaxis protein